jgi:hypothetical protein
MSKPKSYARPERDAEVHIDFGGVSSEREVHELFARSLPVPRLLRPQLGCVLGRSHWLRLLSSPPRSLQHWASSRRSSPLREIEPFATLYEAFRKTDLEVRQLFRPSILKITWLSDTQVRFRGYCNTGTYLITIETANPKQPPTTKKLSDEWIDE